MRFWAVAPHLIDAPKGLGGVWREAATAFSILAGEKAGGSYAKHAQLTRFRETGQPAEALVSYLETIYRQAGALGYSYRWPDRYRARWLPEPVCTVAPVGQIVFELALLAQKTAMRASPELSRTLRTASLHVAACPADVQIFVSPTVRVDVTDMRKAHWERMSL